MRLALGVFLAVVVAGKIFGGEVVRVASWNLENYLVSEERVADGIFRKNYPKTERQKDAVRRVIREAGADVWVFQEIGGEEFLRELQRDLRSEGVVFEHAAFMRGADEVRGLGVLSKRAVGVRRHEGLEFDLLGKKERVRRGVLEVKVGDFAVFVVHLKSRFTVRADDPGAVLQRLGEAGAVRECVLKEFSEPREGRFLVMGDFNDTVDSRTLKAVMGRGKLKVGEWVEAVDSRGEAWTYFYRKQLSYERVDHAVVSPGLKGDLLRAGICDGEDVMEASDHRPLWVEVGKAK